MMETRNIYELTLKEPITPVEERNYLLFFKEWDDASDIFFHGTTLSAYKKILMEGFKKGQESGSTSFSKKASAALQYAIDKRGLNKNGDDPAVVIAVKFKNVEDLADYGHAVHFYKHKLYNSNTRDDGLIIQDCAVISDNYP